MDKFILIKNPPQTRKKTPIGSQSVWKCKICKKNQASYTCPRCNLPYCSAECYKSQSHADCSEEFYKTNVMDELKNSRVSDETKRKMIDILNKMQRETDEEPDVLDHASSDKEMKNLSLAERLSGIDLDEDDHDEIWERLTDEERHEFEEFLCSENLAQMIDVWEPWWMKPIVRPKIVELDEQNRSPFDISDRPDIPPIIEPPDLTPLFSRHPPSPSVPLSLLNLFYAYTLIARVYNGAHRDEPEEVTANLLEISCGLRGDCLLQSSEEAILRVMNDADQSSLKDLLCSRELRAMGMLDVMKIVEERVFVEAALSDLCLMLKKAWMKGKKKEWGNAYKKVEYFLAFVERDYEAMPRFLPNIQLQQVDYLDETVGQQKADKIIESHPEIVSSNVAAKPMIEEIPQ